MRNILFFVLCVLTGLSRGQWSTTQMPLEYDQVSGAANFSKVYLTGGYDANTNYNYFVQEYDRIADVWDDDYVMLLNTGRIKVSTALVGDRLLCAGGWVYPSQVSVGAVEVFDVNNGEILSEDQLSDPRVEMATAVIGNKVLFAGGHDAIWNGSIFECVATDAVDIYDAASGTWTVATLSQARAGMATAVLDGKAYFAGGYQGTGVGQSDRVDIYDAANDSWTTATLSVARSFYGGGVTVGGKVMFAGGITGDYLCSDVVDIYDPVADQWTTDVLSAPREGVQAAAVGNYALFAGGGCGVADWYYTTASDVVDIYDATNDTWSTATMSSQRINFLSVASGNQVLLVGGYDILNDAAPLTVDVFTDGSTIGINEMGAPSLSVWPNPFADRVTIGSLAALGGCKAQVFDAQGKLVLSERLVNALTLDLGQLPPGTYGLHLATLDGREELGHARLVKLP